MSQTASIFCTVVPPYLLESVAEAPTESTTAEPPSGTPANPARRGLRPSAAPQPPSAGASEDSSTFGPGLESISPETAEIARRTLEIDARLRHDRKRMAPDRSIVEPRGKLSRRISDAENREVLPGKLKRSEGEAAVQDADVNTVYDSFGSIYHFLQEVLNQSSIDGHGVALKGSVHFGDHYDNAFWDGEQMVFGDGDGEVFATFTRSFTVVAHELGHGFLQHTTNFDYQGQAGALNESCADVFGIMAEQWTLKQSVEESDWFIGREVFTDQIAGDALRSMANPGTAYDDPSLGADPQPENMSEFVTTREDNGGVHLNSGIPNRAFYLAATGIGGNSWEGAGRIWMDVLLSRTLPLDATFAAFADATITHAKRIFGVDSSEANAVITAWDQVGVLKK